MPSILHNFTIPRKLYQNISSQATYHHNTLIGEIRERLIHTLNPTYGYTSYPLKYKMQIATAQNFMDTVTFDFKMSKETEELMYTLQNKSNLNNLNIEITSRLAFTMNDPFYEDFRETGVYDKTILNMIETKYK